MRAPTHRWLVVAALIGALAREAHAGQVFVDVGLVPNKFLPPNVTTLQEGDVVVWDRSFGRPQNGVILPEGYALLGSAFPAKISLTDDNRIRLDFVNPRNDEVRALILAKKRP